MLCRQAPRIELDDGRDAVGRRSRCRRGRGSRRAAPARATLRTRLSSASAQVLSPDSTCRYQRRRKTIAKSANARKPSIATRSASCGVSGGRRLSRPRSTLMRARAARGRRSCRRRRRRRRGSSGSAGQQPAAHDGVDRQRDQPAEHRSAARSGAAAPDRAARRSPSRNCISEKPSCATRVAAAPTSDRDDRALRVAQLAQPPGAVADRQVEQRATCRPSARARGRGTGRRRSRRPRPGASRRAAPRRRRRAASGRRSCRTRAAARSPRSAGSRRERRAATRRGHEPPGVEPSSRRPAVAVGAARSGPARTRVAAGRRTAARAPPASRSPVGDARDLADRDPGRVDRLELVDADVVPAVTTVCPSSMRSRAACTSAAGRAAAAAVSIMPGTPFSLTRAETRCRCR